MDYKKINDYLWYGYLPSCEVSSLGLVKGSQDIVDPDWSPREAVEQLDHLFDRLVDATDPPHCVPLSGGWDSRIILAALRKRLNRDEIFCISFGCPGQLDYDIGKVISDSVGVQHYPMNLDNIEVSWGDLKDSATKSAWTYVPDGYVQQAMFSIAKKNNSTLWVGFLGDPLTGGHYQQKNNYNLSVELLESFSLKQRREKEVQLSHTDYDPIEAVKCKYEQSELFTASEFLDFSIRQRNCIAPIVLPSGKWSGWTPIQDEINGRPVITPFCDAQWAKYWLSMPRKYHKGQKLYQEMAELSFPRLFGMPSKYTWGMSPDNYVMQKMMRLQHGVRNRLHRYFPMLPIRSSLMDNYMDFQKVFRRRDDYIAVIEKAQQVLKQREATPWIDLDSIWKEHYQGKRDHSQALQVLLGLAVNLEANA